MANRRGGRQAVRNGGSGIPGWALFLGGVVVGIVLCAVVVMGGYAPSLRRHDQPQPNPNAVAQQGTSPGIAGTASSAPQFDFYKVLPEKEVVIPNSELSAIAKAEQQKAAAANNGSVPPPATADVTASAQGAYVLQVGSYPDAAGAEAEKARLALQGFTAHVQTINLDGKTWNRVRVGPFDSATELQAMQQRLEAAGIQAMAMKEK